MEVTKSVKQESRGFSHERFKPIFYDSNLAPIIESYTREEFKNVNAIPKTSYRYWKIENGQKKYLT